MEIIGEFDGFILPIIPILFLFSNSPSGLCSLKTLGWSSLKTLGWSLRPPPDGSPNGRMRILPHEETRSDRSHDETTHPHPP